MLPAQQPRIQRIYVERKVKSTRCLFNTEHYCIFCGPAAALHPPPFFIFNLGNAKIRYMMAPESRKSKAHPQFEREASSDLSV